MEKLFGIGIALHLTETIGSALKNEQNSVVDFGNSIKNTGDKLNSQMAKTKSHIADMKTGVLSLVAVGETMRRTIVSPMIGAAIDFESAMADVKKVVDFDGEDDVKAFQGELLKLSETIPLTQEGLASIAAAGGQLGIAKGDLINFTETVSKMSTAFDMTAEKAGDSIAKLMNVYGLSVEETESLGDAINHISDGSAAKAGDMIEILARAGGTAKMFGLSAESTASLGGAFLAMGKKAEVAGTAISSILMRLQTSDKQGATFQKALQEVGFSAEEMKEMIEQDGEQALFSFLKAVEGIDKGDQMGLLVDLFGTGFADDAALLVSGLENYEKAISLVGDKTKYAGSMQREFEARSATTQNQLILFRSSLNKIGITLGSALLPAINTVVGAVTEATNWFAQWSEENPKTAKTIAMIGTVLTGIALTVGAVGTAMTIAGPGVMLLATAFKVASFAVLGFGKALLFSPIGWIIGGIAAVVLGIRYMWKNWEGFRDGITFIWEGIKIAFSAGWELIKTIFNWSPLGIVINNWGAIKEFFSKVWEGIKGAFSVSWEWIKGALKWSPLGLIIENWGGIKDYFSELWDSVYKEVTGVFGSINDTIGDTWKSVKNFFGFGGDDEKTVTLSTNNNATMAYDYANVPSIPQSTANSVNANSQYDINVEVNNPANNIDITKAVTEAMQQNEYKKRNLAFQDGGD